MGDTFAVSKDYVDSNPVAEGGGEDSPKKKLARSGLFGRVAEINNDDGVLEQKEDPKKKRKDNGGVFGNGFVSRTIFGNA